MPSQRRRIKIRYETKTRTAIHNFEDFRGRSGEWVRSFVATTGSEYIQYFTRANVLWNNVNYRVKSGSKLQQKEPTYVDCTNDFINFQDFAEWCNNEREYHNKDSTGKYWEIDKDLSLIGNKSYSSETCCFIPQSVNKLLNCRVNSRGVYPMGVYFETKAGKLKAQCRTGTGNKFLGYYDNSFEAHKAWQIHKIQQIEAVLKSNEFLPEKAINGLHLRISILKDDISLERETLYI